MNTEGVVWRKKYTPSHFFRNRAMADTFGLDDPKSFKGDLSDGVLLQSDSILSDDDDDAAWPSAQTPPGSFRYATVGALEVSRSASNEELFSSDELVWREVGDSHDHHSALESLDYDPSMNVPFLQAARKDYLNRDRNLWGFTGRTLSRWFLTAGVGTLVGIVACMTDNTAAMFNRARNEWILSKYGWQFGGFLAFILWNAVLVGGSSLLALKCAPGAIGSGIPEVKSYLNGVRMKKVFSGEVLFVKFLGTALCYSTGLMIGPEGPLVHMGAILGSLLTGGQSNFHIKLPFGLMDRRISWRCEPLMEFRSDKDRRDFITIGAAAGFGGAFGAPIGGVLFALEEACSFWTPILMWRTVLATLMATFVLLLVNNLFREMNGDAVDKSLTSGLINLQGTQTCDMSELPLFAMIGVIGGLLGALFNFLFEKKMRYFKSLNLDYRVKVRNIVIVSVVTSIVLYSIPAMFGDVACRPRAKFVDDADDEENDMDELWIRYGCKKSETNVIASIFFGQRSEAIREFLEEPHQFRASSLVVMFLVFFPFTVASFCQDIPTGVFLPTILSGSCMGAIFGKIVVAAMDVEPGSDVEERILRHCALGGCVALLGGLLRSTVSLCVIIMEGTGQTELLLPIIVTSVCARTVGNYFNIGLYELAMEMKGVPFLENHIHRKYHIMKVSDVMRTNVVTLRTVATVKEILRVLRNTTHNGFPVVSNDGRLRGTILRSQLRQILKRNLYFDPAELKDGLSPRASSPTAEEMSPMNRAEVSDSGTENENDPEEGRKRADSVEEALQVPLNPREEDERELGGDEVLSHPHFADNHSDSAHHKVAQLERFMNQGPHVVQKVCPVSRAYHLFITLGLRHLPVLDTDGKLVGILTRSEMLSLHNFEAVRPE